jgi:poly(3-hydroxybutyrate) depolymerase
MQQPDTTQAEGVRRITRLKARMADKEGFVVAYPNGSGRLKTRLLTWNSGNGAKGA